MHHDERKMKVKKGWMAVQVGLEHEDGGFRKFSIPISHLYHPLFQSLLEKAREVYGYTPDGPLRLPISVDDFLHLRWRIDREPSLHHHHHHHHLPVPAPVHSLPFRSC